MTKYLYTLLAVFTLGITQMVLADSEKETTTYEVTMTGVTWGGCKKHVREAFKKLDGIVVVDVEKDIQIEAGAKSGTQKVTFKSTSSKITKEAAIASLGSQASTYVVKELAVAGEKSKEGKE